MKSVDASGYEGADFVIDLGVSQTGLPEFDLVIDFGSLEHIFDVGAALRNVIALCRPGGRIAHVLPANNLAGHGFWQFSADLFFELYSTENGFDETEVYYASAIDETVWYRTRRSRPGERFEFVSLEPISVVCITRKTTSVPEFGCIAQPFYSGAWKSNSSGHLRDGIATHRGRMARAKNILRKTPAIYRLARNLHLVLGLATGRSPYGLKKLFEPIQVQALLRHSLG